MTVTCKAEESLTCSCVDVGRLLTGQIALLIFIKPMRIKLKLKRHLIVSLKKHAKQKAILATLKVKSQKLKMVQI